MRKRDWRVVVFVALGVCAALGASAQDGRPATAAEREAIVREVLREVPLIDGHNDAPWAIRSRVSNHLGDFDFFDTTVLERKMHTDLRRLREGGVGGQFWSVWIPTDLGDAEAVVAVLEQIDLVHRLVARYPGDLEIALTADDVVRIHADGKIASIGSDERRFFGLQFHPEVVHTEHGKLVLENYVHEICGIPSNWSPASFVEETVAAIREQVGDSKVICALSGGVDSSVMSVLIHRAIGDNLVPIFVDNGVLRKSEDHEVIERLKTKLGLSIDIIDAKGRFLDKLAGVEDPEKKRKIIGTEFIRVFEEEAKKLGSIRFLAQGTLYPDVIESISVKGPSATIKSHHNVGGLPEHMDLELIEPLKTLFKDEVRKVGAELGIDPDILGRHPFPGPGLAVRILGEVTPERVTILQEADAIAIDEMRNAGLYNDIWQAFAVLLPIKTVGVMGDERTYENVVVIRAVDSLDGMTAHWFPMPHEVLERMSARIINEVRGVNRVCYDISSKPPSTIEWE